MICVCSSSSGDVVPTPCLHTLAVASIELYKDKTKELREKTANTEKIKKRRIK